VEAAARADTRQPAAQIPVQPSAAAGPRAPAGPARRHAWPVALVAVAAFAGYFTIGALAYARYTLGSYDMVIFDQAMRSYAHFGAPVSIVKGIHDGLGPDFSILGDHFSPILAVLTPLYWVYDHSLTLIFAEAMLFAAAVPAVWLAARRAVGVAGAYAMAAVFGMGWPLTVASARGFHEVGFSVPLMAWALERLLARKYRQAGALALALLLVKEDMGLVVAGFGLLVWWRGGREHRRLGLALTAIGLAALAIIEFVLIPLGGGEAGYYWLYDELGSGPLQALAHVVVHPLDTLSIAITPERKWNTLLWLAGPLLLLPLLSPVTLLALPLLAERLFSTNGNHWGPNNHYDAFVWPLLVLAAIDALQQDRPRRLLAALAARIRTGTRYPRPQTNERHVQSIGSSERAVHPPRDRVNGPFTRNGVGATLAVAALCVSVFMMVRWFQPWDLPNGDHGRQDRAGAAAAAARLIPDGARVETDNELGPHLTMRAKVLLLDFTPRGADWAIVDTRQWSFPFDTLVSQRFHAALLLASGDYDIVYARDDYLVLHRKNVEASETTGAISELGEAASYDRPRSESARGRYG
jgi:uncharacterized membrane protein